MNKAMQVLEPSNHLPVNSQGMANNSRREEGEGTFSSILSRNNGEESGTEAGQTLHNSGNTLPAQQARVDDQNNTTDSSPAAPDETDPSGTAAVVDELLLAAEGMDQPEPLAVQASGQASAVTAVSVMEDSAMQAPGIEEQPLDAAAAMLAAMAGQQAQGRAGASRLPSMTNPGDAAVSVIQARVEVVRDSGGTRALPDSLAVTAETGRPVAGTEAVAGAVREVLQLAAANQALNTNLKQFMQQHSNQQTASIQLPATSSADTSAVPFMQMLSDSSVAMPMARVQVPVGHPGWGEAMGQQVTWFVSQKISAASLQLNPKHLGPMEMAVSMDGDQASITFTSQQALVRDALESSIPRLREMLSENGLNLAAVNVSQQGKSYRDGQGESGSRHGSGIANDGSGGDETVSVAEARRITLHTQGLVDDYA